MSALLNGPQSCATPSERDPLLAALLERTLTGADLERDEAAQALMRVMTGEVGEAQLAGFLVALRTKGETADELAGMAHTMRLLATAIPVAPGRALLDTAGTGGGRPSFSVSTTAALIAAGAGCAVAKHGNRSSTSRCGSADVIEALGARLELSPAAVARCIDEVGFGFMHGPLHHRAADVAIRVRRQLGVRTIFNLLGPLTNPAGAAHQLIGVSEPGLLDVMAEAARRLGAERAMIACSDDGLDELSASAATNVVELRDGTLRRYRLSPRELGVETTAEPPGAGTPAATAALVRDVLHGRRGPAREIAVVNAGAAIYLSGAAATIARGAAVARRAIDTGAAARVLDRFIGLSQRLGDVR
jgi:anthranilate phosphoribosyltransferase